MWGAGRCSTTRRWASATFLLSRVLASGTRLYFAGILLVVAYLFITGQESAGQAETVVIYILALTFITIATAVYTTLGGLKAVVWTDVLQASVLAVSILTTIGFLFFSIMGQGSAADAWHYIVDTISDTSQNPYGRENLQPWAVFDWGTTGRGFVEDVRNILGSEYTLWSAVLGATFITMATMGTDQDMVQRMLADQQRYDLDKDGAATGNAGSTFEQGDVTLTEENADDFINYINSLNNGK